MSLSDYQPTNTVFQEFKNQLKNQIFDKDDLITIKLQKEYESLWHIDDAQNLTKEQKDSNALRHIVTQKKLNKRKSSPSMSS